MRQIKEIIDHIENDSQEHFKKIKDEVHFTIRELHGAMNPQEKMSVINLSPDLDESVCVVFATKIAETAVTLKDIYYVLDSGLEREYYYDETSKMSLIKETKISKSSAEQRKGRAGRVANGYCCKMYRQEEELKFRDNRLPEVQRMDISDLILAQIKLQDMFKLSDVMFYDCEGFKKSKIDQVRKEVERIHAIETTDMLTTTTTKKGEFILGMSCPTLVAAFLFECHKLGVIDLGVIAASALDNVKRCFNENVIYNSCQQILKEYSEKESSNAACSKLDLINLGDLAPLLLMHKKYEHMTISEKRRFHKEYQVTEDEIQTLFKKKSELIE